MNALHTLGGLAFGLAIPLAGLMNLGQADGPAARGLRTVAAEVLAESPLRTTPLPAGVAEVAVAFDPNGQPTASRLRRSSGSPAVDAAAMSAAVELARLRRPTDVAGRTLLFSASFDAPAALD